ncbi:MAG TPA: hypothetical protein VHZ05_00945 [Acidimicrobiales bacterium]|jgi:hypothetical protein|nr:hypothetical protein [Acidimicrobiales bacterium]
MSAETAGTVRSAPGGRRRAEQVALLTLAMIAGVIGFVLVVFWGIALILMGILWGMMAMERQRYAEPDRGVLGEVVDVVVDAAKDLAHSGSRHDAPASEDPPRRVASSSEAPPRRVASSSEAPPRRVASSSQSPLRQDSSAPAPASHDPLRQDAAYDPPRP